MLKIIRLFDMNKEKRDGIREEYSRLSYRHHSVTVELYIAGG
jgi:hypothetical protein